MSDQIKRTLRLFGGQLPCRVSLPGEDGYAAATAIWAKPVGGPHAACRCSLPNDRRRPIGDSNGTRLRSAAVGAGRRARLGRPRSVPRSSRTSGSLSSIPRRISTAADGIDDAAELCHETGVGVLHGTAPVLLDLRLDQFAQMHFVAFVCAFLVGPHQARITRHVRSQAAGRGQGCGRPLVEDRGLNYSTTRV
jgi:hypothetical protein